MSLPKGQQVWRGDDKKSGTEVELAQLRAQVRALADLLIECGIVDASMVNGRLHSAAARIAPVKRAASQEPRRSWWSRLFGAKDLSEVGAIPTTRLADQTVPVVNLPFKPSGLYGETEVPTDKRRNLTPTDLGKCGRCWRMRPLASSGLCFRCVSGK